ncbi:MAG: DUF4350 domain-containing protein [Pseudomonadota bacterium]
MTETHSAPFSRTGVLALILVGFGVFFALLYLIGVGDIGQSEDRGGGAHAAAKGINGYSALSELVEADGFRVSRSREQGGLSTGDLLVLTPPPAMDPEELAKIITDREYLGPTLVILPKWSAIPPNFLIPIEDPEEVEDGWVFLAGVSAPRWADEESGPLALSVSPARDSEGSVQVSDDPPADTFATLGPIAGISGELPTGVGFVADPEAAHTPIVVNQEKQTLALIADQFDGGFEDDESGAAPWVVFVIEPDLMNNWGLADKTRAQAALSIVRMMGDDYSDSVVFDLTLNGFGGPMNLLTLAFQPPFLAATICLLLAFLIVGWRAFVRFGAATIPERETAFGKARLVSNGADLIIRAGRLKLLAEPYIALSALRLARTLGLRKPDHGELDTALAVRQPKHGSFTKRAQDMREADKPTEILRAARALSDQTQRL